MEENKIPIARTRWSTDREEHRFTVYNPSTGRPCAQVQGGGVEEVDLCVREAHRAFREVWSPLSPHQRGAYLKQAAEALRQHKDEIAKIETEEVGKPLHISQNDVRRCIEAFEFFGGMVGNLPGELYELGPVNASVFWEPFGVVACIVPFNWPPLHTGAKLAPALAAGNTVVVKPGDQAPLSVMRIVEVVREALPQGVLELVTGPGAETGKALTAHPLVRKISFTGSDQSGRAVVKQSADNLTPCIMELGGKNAMIVMPGCDLDKVAPMAFEGAFYNNGEACTATSRFLVHASLCEEFSRRLGELVRRARLGAGADPRTHIGPMVTRQHQRKVLDYIRIGQEEGARIAAQGELPGDPELREGYFVAPTLFTGVTPAMRIAREEIFGPVACVIPFEDEEEAVSIANDTDFGLIAVVCSEDYQQAMRVARRLDMGCVYINNFYRLGAQCVPFGGNKASGFGRERCVETLREYSRPKAVRVPSGLGEIPVWRLE